MRRATGWEPDWFRGRVVPGDHRRHRRRRHAHRQDRRDRDDRGDRQGAHRRPARGRDRRGQRSGERARPARCAARSTATSRRSSACTSPTTRCACSTRTRAPARSTRVLIDSTDGDATWTTIGVNENIIEASWQALLDSIHFGLLRAEHRRDRLLGSSVPRADLGRVHCRPSARSTAPRNSSLRSCRLRALDPERQVAPPDGGERSFGVAKECVPVAESPMRRRDVEHPELTPICVVGPVSLRTEGAHADNLSRGIDGDSDLGPQTGVLVAITKPTGPRGCGPRIVQPVEDRIGQESAVADAPTVVLRPRDLLSIRDLRRSHERLGVHGTQRARCALAVPVRTKGV